MPTLTINGEEITVEPGTTVLQACEEAGHEIPRFCYHERLSIAGNCRMCLVEMERSPKPIASCAMPAGDGMVIHTDTPAVKKAREGVMEFLLINHPLDCPICDQGGECDLQDQAMAYGRGANRFDENKRAVAEKHMGPLIKTIMTRCIHCTRCVRFAEEVAGVPEIGAIYRGENMQITTYLEQAVESEMSGNVIDLCPVGALTSKPYAFTARSWELRKTPSVDVMDAVGSNIRLDSRGPEVMRILPRIHDDVNEEWISDKTRFCYDGLKYRRLDRPYVRNSGKLQAVTWGEAFETIAHKLKGLKGEEIAAVSGPLAELESMAALKDLMAKLGSNRVESRIRGSKLEPGNRGDYLFNSGIAGIEEADHLLLIGCNPRDEAAIINTRILKATRHTGLKVARIGAPADLRYDVQDLGDNASILAAVAKGKHDYSKTLKQADKPLIIIGQSALARTDGAAIHETARALASEFGIITDEWNGFNVLAMDAAAVGGLDLGLTSEGGTEAILADAAKGTIKAVFNMGVDDLPAGSLAKPFTVFIGSHGDAGVKDADVILPGAAYSEKPGLYINTEGRVQLGQRAVPPLGDAREDWTILRALSDVLGATLPYDTLSALRERIADELPHIKALDELPSAKPTPADKPGTIEATAIAPLIDDFFRANAIARASRILKECSDLRYGAAPQEATGTDG